MQKRTKMIVFDMDGVLVDIESSWGFIHKAFRVDGRNNLERYLQGEFDYEEFMRRDIELWGRVHISQIRSILDQVPLMKGAKVTTHELRESNYKTAIISSGLCTLAENLKKKLKIDYVCANSLLVNERGMLTGEGKAVVGLWDKAKVLHSLTKSLGITSEQCAVIGDSIYDVPLFKAAGFSIAFNSEDDKVRKNAIVSIDSKDLREILPYLVFPR